MPTFMEKPYPARRPWTAGLQPGEARLRPPGDDGGRMRRSRPLAVPLVLSRARSLASFATVAAEAAE
jgi:hypothetical protein